MVKYAPRKVYIRESGGYVELSYTEFCRCRESDQTYMDKLFIPIQGCLLEVVREQYTDFYRDKERWRYLQKLDTKNRLLSLDGFTDSEGNPLDFITDEAVDIAETVVNAVMVDRLKAALPLLSDSEQELIQAIFFDGLSEREVGARLGITQSVVNKRKARILINSDWRKKEWHTTTDGRTGNGVSGKKRRKSCCVSAALMKRPLSRYAWRTGQTSIPTGGFTDGRMTLRNILRTWQAGSGRRKWVRLRSYWTRLRAKISIKY